MNKNAEKRVQRLFAGMESSLDRTDPEFVEIISNFSQDETAGVSKLTEKEQMLCILSALLGCHPRSLNAMNIIDEVAKTVENQ